MTRTKTTATPTPLAADLRKITRDAAISKIAFKSLGLTTLATRYNDSLDFHEHSVGSIKNALESAYAAGVMAVISAREGKA